MGTRLALCVLFAAASSAAGGGGGAAYTHRCGECGSGGGGGAAAASVGEAGESDAAFRARLGAAAGASAVGNTVVVVVANAGFGAMLDNYLCALAAAGATPPLLVGASAAAARQFAAAGYGGFYAAQLAAADAADTAQKAGSGGWLTLLDVKLRAVRELLALGYDVLLNDADVVWFRDVREETLERCQGLDMCFMWDGPSKAGMAHNTGFWWSRASERTVAAMDEVLALRRGALRGENDQYAVNAVLAARGNETLRHGLLPSDVYLNGLALLCNKQASLPERRGIVHINWTRTPGQKKDALRKWGLWRCGGSHGAAHRGAGVKGVDCERLTAPPSKRDAERHAREARAATDAARAAAG